MIRDPSDGSVKEKPRVEMTTALPTVDVKELARLEKSREWLKEYALVAQRIEQGSSKPEVAGSIPAECSPANALKGK